MENRTISNGVNFAERNVTESLWIRNSSLIWAHSILMKWEPHLKAISSPC